jgi:hypothetical protein
MHTRTIVATSVAALALAGLAGCSSSDEPAASEASSAAPAASASATMVGGMATCDEAAFQTAVTDLLAAGGDGEKLFSIDDFQCVDGWAAVFPTVGTTEDNAITETLVFQAEGQFWIPKDRMEVCGTANMDDPTAYPADSQVPEALWQPACNTN